MAPSSSLRGSKITLNARTGTGKKSAFAGSFVAYLSASLACACAPSVPNSPPNAPPLSGPASPRAIEPPAATPARVDDIEPLPALRSHFDAERATGTIALYDSARGRLGCSDVQRCRQGVYPASTFKIPNALIALETGVVEDSETLIKWDGKERSVPEWNHDQTLRSAIRVSCVPCFQWIARSVGPARMQDFVNRFDYGNHDISGGIDLFWFQGGLRISPIQQIDFLRRLEAGKLPASPKNLEILLDMLALDVGRNHVLRGKTGFQGPPETKDTVGWFVGWVELGERRVFFATLIESVPPDVDMLPLRRRLTERILEAEGLLPD